MATCSAALAVSKEERDHLGRWIKTRSQIVTSRSQEWWSCGFSTLREPPDAATIVGEPVSLSEIKEYLQARWLPEEIINRQ